MIQLQDTIHNTKLIYLYVNKFDYGKNQMGKEQSSGNPKSKKVYRAIYNTDTNSYRIIYDVDSKNVFSVFIEDLQSTDEDLGYTCDIKILSVSNILDFNISEADLDQLLKWLQTDNKDVKDILGDIGAVKKVEGKVTKPAQQPAQPPKGTRLPPELVQLINIGSELHKADPIIFGTIFDLMIYLNQDAYADTGVLGTGWLKLDKDHGAGVNVSAAIDKLSRYLGQDRRINLDNDDLMGAIKDLLIEKSRRNYHEIE